MPIVFELVTEKVVAVPAKETYEPPAVVLLPIAFKGEIEVCLVRETEAPVLKLPDDTKDQYSEELMAESVVPSGDPPEPVLNASTVSVTGVAVVVGFTNAKGR